MKENKSVKENRDTRRRDTTCKRYMWQDSLSRF